MSRFIMARDFAVMTGRIALQASVEDLRDAIREGETALAAGPVLDPTLYRDGAGELQEQLDLLKAFLEFREALERFRPEAVIER